MNHTRTGVCAASYSGIGRSRRASAGRLATLPASSPSQAHLVKTFEIDCELAYEVTSPIDFVFHIEAAQLEGQRVVAENLKIAPACAATSSI